MSKKNQKVEMEAAIKNVNNEVPEEEFEGNEPAEEERGSEKVSFVDKAKTKAKAGWNKIPKWAKIGGLTLITTGLGYAIGVKVGSASDCCEDDEELDPDYLYGGGFEEIEGPVGEPTDVAEYESPEE